MILGSGTYDVGIWNLMISGFGTCDFRIWKFCFLDLERMILGCGTCDFGIYVGQVMRHPLSNEYETLISEMQRRSTLHMRATLPRGAADKLADDWHRRRSQPAPTQCGNKE